MKPCIALFQSQFDKIVMQKNKNKEEALSIIADLIEIIRQDIKSHEVSFESIGFYASRDIFGTFALFDKSLR